MFFQRFERSLSHGREICDRRYAHVDTAAEEGKQLPGGLKSEKHLAEVVKNYDREAAEMRKPRNTSVGVVDDCFLLFVLIRY